MKLKLEPEYYIFKYLWIFLLIPKLEFYFAIGVACLLVLRMNYKIRYSSTILLVASWAIVMLISVVLNFGKDGETIKRLVGDTAVICMWIVALIFYSYFTHHVLNLVKLKRYFLWSSGILIGISLLYLIVPNAPIELFGKTLAQIDYSSFSANGLRLRGFLEYATLNTTVVMCILPILFVLPLKKFHKLSWLLLLNLPVYLSGSRIGVLSMLVVDCIYLYTILHKKYRGIIIVFFSLFTLFMLVLFFDELWSYVINFYSSRSLSNNARFIIYQESVDAVIAQNLIFGAGASIYSRAGNWLGTHSQYISVFYRSGVLGSLLACAGFYSLFRQMYRATTHKLLIFGYMIAVLIFWLFETIDPAHIYLLLWLSTIGIVSNRMNWQSYDQLMSK